MTQTPEKEERPLTFEEALAKLEDLLGKMESGRQPLESLIADFEEGSRLLKLCRGKLEEMEKRIEVLQKDDGASGAWQDFGGVETPRTQL